MQGDGARASTRESRGVSEIITSPAGRRYDGVVRMDVIHTLGEFRRRRLRHGLRLGRFGGLGELLGSRGRAAVAVGEGHGELLGEVWVVDAPGHELAFGVEVGDLAAEEAAGPEEGDVRLASGEPAVPVALMLVAHGSDVPFAARRQHRAAGAALGARRALGALGAAVAPAVPPGPAPRAGALRAVHLALGDRGRSVTVIATVRSAPASTELATAALVAAALALRSLTDVAVVAALAARVALAGTAALAALETFAARFAAGQRAADLAATSEGERVGSGENISSVCFDFFDWSAPRWEQSWNVTHHGRQQEVPHVAADPRHLTGHSIHPARQSFGFFLYQTSMLGMQPRHDAA